jgi:NADH:ubiquinone oxidoreductase subunit 6 (subunit J)
MIILVLVVVSVLFLIGLFGNVASYLILIGLGFMGLAYLVVYIGAIIIGIIKPLWFNLVALVQIQLYGVASSLLIIIQIFQIVVYSNFPSYPLYHNNSKLINRIFGSGFLLSNPRLSIVKLSSVELICKGETYFSTLSNRKEIGSFVPLDDQLYNDEKFLN